MRLVVNGQELQISDVRTIEDLLRRLEIDAKFRAVAVNREVVGRGHYSQKTLQDGDRVEIVRPVSGG